MSIMYDVAVIGNGLIGAAATRHLSAMGLNVVAIGPEEPQDWKRHSGPFASHYDQGRITRIIDPYAAWGLLAKRSIEAYPALEEASGVRFHGAVGCLRVSPDTTVPHDSLTKAEAVGREHEAVYTVEHSDEGLNEIFPFLQFPAGSTALWERGGAGYVNPRQLVQAQLTAAAQQGATVIAATVTDQQKQGDHVQISTSSGATIAARKVLISAGAYSSWLLDRPLAYRRKAVTIVLAELAAAEAERLRATPSIIYRLENHPVLASIYSLPPIQYPDGNYHLKIGGTLHTPKLLHTPEEIRTWFHGDGDATEAKAIREVLFGIFPNLAASAVQSRPCVVTYTDHEYPYIGQIDEQTYLVTGGCGAAAKSSDEIGRVGAMLVKNEGEWRYDIPADLFQIRYADEA